MSDDAVETIIEKDAMRATLMPTQTTKPKSPRHVGLVCRHCGCRHFATVYTRPRHDGIARRKRCRNCGRAITTRERIV